MSDIYGLGSERQLAFYDPDTQSWKMFGDISLWGEYQLLESLPPSGMTRNGVLFLQPAWEPITDATESSLWPTPTAVHRPMEGNVRMYQALIEAGEMTEEEATQILGKSPWEAQGKIPAMWPTPTARDYKDGRTPRIRNGRIQTDSVGRAVQIWPTPRAGPMCGGTGAANQIEERYSDGTITSEERQAMRAGNGGILNPTWVEWLMGFPTGWTDLED